MKEPVLPSKATRPKQFSILTRARRDTHGLRPSTIPVPIGEGTHLRVNWSDNVRYLDPVHRPQAQVEQTRTIVVTRARGTLNSMKLLGNSVKVFDHDKLATGIQRDPPPGPYIRLPDMVQTTKSTFKDLTGRTGRSGKMDARGIELYRDSLRRPIAIPPIHIRLQLSSKAAAFTLLTIPNSSQLIQRLGVSWYNMGELKTTSPVHYTQGQAHPTLPDLIGLFTEPHDHILVFLRLIQLRLFSYTPFNKLCSMTGPGGRGA